MKRVLMVDDSPTVVQAAYDELEELGYLVEVAYNGREAIGYLEQNPNDLPDLIVMDIEMPKLSGDEATKIIRANPAWKHVPVIALTGKSPESMAEFLSLFNNYLVKPFGFDQMLALVKEIMGDPD